VQLGLVAQDDVDGAARRVDQELNAREVLEERSWHLTHDSDLVGGSQHGALDSTKGRCVSTMPAEMTPRVTHDG
jgi:hypothetical protein